MSVSDPLLKEIKGHTSILLKEIEENEFVSDDSEVLLPFCCALEKIFYFGLLQLQNKFGFAKNANEPWVWLQKFAAIENSSISFSFKSAVDKASRNCTVQSDLGRFRLLVRLCLVAKCLHEPLQYLIHFKRLNTYYGRSSIIGDEILSQILLSVLLQCSKLNFKLDVNNASFLDITWRIPEVIQLELVPCKELGISVSFSGEKAVIVNLKPGSVVIETGKIEMGDILDNLNGVHICSTTKGRLNAILHNNKKRPITIRIIKTIYTVTQELYPPAIKLLKDVNLDPIVIKEKHTKRQNTDANLSVVTKQKNSAGFKVTYLGYIDVGKQGDVRQIDRAAKMLLYPRLEGLQREHKKSKQIVFFEIGEIGVKIVDFDSNEVILKNSYMEISSCASLSCMTDYFAYIAGAENCSKPTNFICHVFHSKNTDNVFTILQSIGQGFHRTHFAV